MIIMSCIRKKARNIMLDVRVPKLVATAERSQAASAAP